MAAVTVNVNLPASTGTSLSTALQEVTPGTGVAFVQFVADADCYLVISASGSDGGSISGLSRMLIPANTIYAIPTYSHGTKVFVAAVSGTATGYFFGVDRG